MPEDQQPAPQPQAVTTPKSHDWKKVGLTVLIILVVSGLLVAAYWFLVLNKSSDNSDLTGPVPKVTTKTAQCNLSEKSLDNETSEKSDSFKVYTSFVEAVFEGNRDRALDCLSSELIESEYIKEFDFSTNRSKFGFSPKSIKNLSKDKIVYGALITNPDFESELVLFSLSLTAGIWKIEKIEDPKNILNTPQNSEKASYCKKYELEKEEYLRVYIVKEGDTLESVASSELGDINKVDQIRQLNGDSILSGSQLKVGQSIYLPREEDNDSKGLLLPVVGKILNINGATIGVSTTAGSLSTRTISFSNTDNIEGIGVGDCVVVILDKGDFNKPVSIKLQ